MKTAILLTHSNRFMGTLIYRSTPFVLIQKQLQLKQTETECFRLGLELIST